MVLFLLFLAIGVGIGIFGTKKFLASRTKEEEKEEQTETPEVVIVNITDDSSYAPVISELYSYLDKNPIYYNSQGFDITTASNETKLKLVYNYIVSHKLDSVTTIPASWDGTTCPFNGGLNSVVVDAIGSGCTVSNISVSQINEIYKKLFGNTGIDPSVNFQGADAKTCVLVGDTYTCGKTTGSIHTGSLQPKMDVLKAEKYDDDIVITEKGYLHDTRSNVVVTEENYYLHSSDSTEYYHELKSSDNLYFIHTFKKNEDGTYTYLKTTTKEKKDS